MTLHSIRFAKLPPAPVQFPNNGVCHKLPCPWHLKPDEVSFSRQPKDGKPSKPNQAAGKPAK